MPDPMTRRVPVIPETGASAVRLFLHAAGGLRLAHQLHEFAAITVGVVAARRQCLLRSRRRSSTEPVYVAAAQQLREARYRGRKLDVALIAWAPAGASTRIGCLMSCDSCAVG